MMASGQSMPLWSEGKGEMFVTNPLLLPATNGDQQSSKL